MTNRQPGVSQPPVGSSGAPLSEKEKVADLQQPFLVPVESTSYPPQGNSSSYNNNNNSLGGGSSSGVGTNVPNLNLSARNQQQTSSSNNNIAPFL